jgi:hypothetical protein
MVTFACQEGFVQEQVQLLARADYFYAGRTGETGASQVLPPDTLLYGGKLRVLDDNMRRNLLELPLPQQRRTFPERAGRRGPPALHRDDLRRHPGNTLCGGFRRLPPGDLLFPLPDPARLLPLGGPGHRPGGRRNPFQGDHFPLRNRSLDCAFFWKSAFYLAYVWDSGAIRGGRSGNSLLLTWNKLF